MLGDGVGWDGSWGGAQLEVDDAICLEVLQDGLGRVSRGGSMGWRGGGLGWWNVLYAWAVAT